MINRIIRGLIQSEVGRKALSDSLRDNYPWLAELEARERAIAIVQTEAAYAAGFLRTLAHDLEERELKKQAIECRSIGDRLEDAIEKAMERGKTET